MKFATSLFLLSACFTFESLAAESQFHPPETQEGKDFTPRETKWIEPQALRLPSAEALETITITGKTYEIGAPSPEIQAAGPTLLRPAFAFHEDLGRSLYFRGSGRGGLESKERLVVEDCTFIIDFQGGNFEAFDPRQSAVFVEGYKEVLVRNCIFFSKATGRDPLRKVVGSLIAYDCVKVQVEDCYFEGRTAGWRGHLLAWGCGPTSIRNCEINGRGSVAGGIWVATGVGEGKIGWPHEDNPELMIYPPGPLLVEGCWVHDQTGKENSDGIYVQSIRPYLLRNCKVERWGEDSLVDLGFRDTAPNQYHGKTLVNHGGIGVVENCEFSGGWLKTSVGLGGGLIFRNNLLRGTAWLFPYVFDGGSWYVLGNEWDDLTSVIASGRNGQTDGWAPKEGMLTNGGKMMLFNNRFATKPDAKVKALFVAGSQPALKECIVADYNHYAFESPPAVWAMDRDAKMETLDDWRTQTGNDVHSLVSTGSRDQFKDLPVSTVKLPGGISMQWGETNAGLSAPAGVQNPDVAARAKALSEAFARDFAGKNFTLEAESLAVAEKTLEVSTEKRSWAGGGAYLDFRPKAEGERITFLVKRENPGRYQVESISTGVRGAISFQLAVDGIDLANPVDFSKRGPLSHGIIELAAGEHRFTYTAIGSGRGELDAIEFRDADSVLKEQERLKASKLATEEKKAARDKVDASKIVFDFADLPVAGKPRGHVGVHQGKGGAKYLLWQPKEVGDSLAFEVDVPQAGTFSLSATTSAQVDKGELQLVIDNEEIGDPAAIGGSIKFGSADLTADRHVLRLKLAATTSHTEPKVRLLRLELLLIDP